MLGQKEWLIDCIAIYNHVFVQNILTAQNISLSFLFVCLPSLTFYNQLHITLTKVLFLQPLLACVGPVQIVLEAVKSMNMRLSSSLSSLSVSQSTLQALPLNKNKLRTKT